MNGPMEPSFFARSTWHYKLSHRLRSFWGWGVGGWVGGVKSIECEESMHLWSERESAQSRTGQEIHSVPCGTQWGEHNCERKYPHDPLSSVAQAFSLLAQDEKGGDEALKSAVESTAFNFNMHGNLNFRTNHSANSSSFGSLLGLHVAPNFSSIGLEPCNTCTRVALGRRT